MEARNPNTLVRDTNAQYNFLRQRLGISGDHNMNGEGLQKEIVLDTTDGVDSAHPNRVSENEKDNSLDCIGKKSGDEGKQKTLIASLKSYRDVINGDIRKEETIKAIRPLVIPRREGGNVIVELDMGGLRISIWIRLLELPLEYRKEQNVLNIVGGIGLPLKIDPLSLNLYCGMYARVLVDVDLTQPLPERILVKMIDIENRLDISFFVPVFYELLPKFCINCVAFTHSTDDCKIGVQLKDARPSNRYGVQRLGNSIFERREGQKITEVGRKKVSLFPTNEEPMECEDNKGSHMAEWWLERTSERKVTLMNVGNDKVARDGTRQTLMHGTDACRRS